MIQHFDSRYFGKIAVDPQSIIEFPAGLPGFEDSQRFIVLQHADQSALAFLQSLENTGLCFLALPVGWLRPDYQLDLAEEDLELLGLPADGKPVPGRDVVALALLSLVEGQEPTANLLSPIVIRAAAGKGVQAIRPDGRYSCREPLRVVEAVCS
jgi:flagellar assembly factor FliW